MLRVCPKCNSRLGSYDNFFCSSCGYELPKELVLKSPSKSKITFFKSDSKKSSKSRKSDCSNSLKTLKAILPILLLVFFVGFPLFLVFNSENFISDFLFNNSIDTLDYLRDRGGEKVEKEITFTSDAPVVATEKKILVSDYIPYEADVYFEIKGINRFFDYFVYSLEGDDLAKLENFISEDNFDDKFGFFAKKVDGTYIWAYILFPKKELKTLSIKDFELTMVYDSLVIDPEGLMYPTVEQAKEGLVKNLSMNTFFKDVLGSTDKYGMFALVLNSQTREYLSIFSDVEGLPQGFINVAKILSQSDKGYLILE